MRKVNQNSADNNEGIEAALKDYREKKFKSVNAAAKAHGVAESTLRARVKGRKTRAEASEMKQLLSAAEEKALVRWILEVSKTGQPPSKPQVQQMAEYIRQQHLS